MRKAGVNLPHPATVRSWIAEYTIEMGFSPVKSIENKLKDSPLGRLLTALKFDEISLKAYEEYSKQFDMIEGLVDLGSKAEGGLGRQNEKTKHVLLFLQQKKIFRNF